MGIETTPGILDATRERRQLVRFDPTLSTGSLVQIITLIGGGVLAYGVFTAERVRTDEKVSQIERAAVAEKQQTKESISDLRSDVKQVQQTLNLVTNQLAIINERQQSQKGKQ